MQSDFIASQDLFRLLSESASDGMFTVDLKGNIVYTNNSFDQLIRMPFSKIKGKHFTRYVAEGSRERALSCFRAAQDERRGVKEEIDILDKKGECIPVEIHASGLVKNNRTIAVHAILRDISRRRHLEFMAREAEKMRALNDFVADTAKEIKYPLEAILSRTKTAVQEYKHRDFEYIGYKEFCNIVHTIENIGRQVEECWQTTDRLLNIHRRKTGGLSLSCNAGMVLRAVVQSREERLKGVNLKLKLKLQDSLPKAAIGDTELTHVINSILDNAIEAMPAGGQVDIKAARAEGNCISIEIKDQGVGILKENIPNIFEPFFTTKAYRVEKKSGLGLTIVQSILRAYRGEISVRSNLRHGTTVKISLPVYRKSRNK